MSTSPVSSHDALTSSAFRKARRRVIPVAFGLYIISYLDRVNIGFAAPTMSADLDFGPEVFGFAAGIFFVSYAALEIPSTLAARRFGTRVWLARILVTWGLLSAMTGFVQNEVQLFAVRFLLGAAEAGAFPILLLWVTSWMPRDQRGRAFALFIASLPVAAAIGAPLSGVILSMDGAMGLEGWRLLFIIEAIPALIAGVWVLRRLPLRGESVSWLTPDENRALLTALSDDEAKAGDQAETIGAVRAALSSARVWVLGASFLCIALGFYSLTLWQPTLISDALPSLSSWQQGLVNAPPFLLAAMAMVMIGRRADRQGAIRWMVVALIAVSATGMLVISVGGGIGYLGLVLATMAIWSAAGIVWVTPTRLLTGVGAASGVPLINSIGALGGFIGPYTVGVLVADVSLLASLGFVAVAVVTGSWAYFFVARRVESNQDGAARG